MRFCEKSGENQVYSRAPQRKGVHEGCGFSLYLFDTFINNII
jgi:hypothetical protein